jgi:3-deoxy-manno-octulosonate cytidylyltransferase (CMP-KDO synthetase)
MSTLILIPARLGSTRLPGKVLADIAGAPMIVHVWRRAVESGLGEVAVAADSQEIVDAVEKAGGRAVLTRPEHPSGSDRIFEALNVLDPDHVHDRIVNVQGDLPTIDPAAIAAANALLDVPEVDIGTLGAVITRPSERSDPNVVKIVASGDGARRRCLYFTRATAPWGEGELIHHIGLYAWRRAALGRFVRLFPSPLEVRERLEQLRALEAGMRIDAALIEDVPLGVDTGHDLERAREMLSAQPL